MTHPDLPPGDFALFQSLLVEESGLHFDEHRHADLRNALLKRMNASRVHSFPEYYQLLRAPHEGRRELHELIELLTVGETYFYRNAPQFDALRDHVLPELVSQRLHGPRTLKVWSAACATGEEPYTLAMALLEWLPDPDSWQITILATDINREHMRQAERAVYGPRAVRMLPPAWLAKHFRSSKGEHALDVKIKRMVSFTHHNLVAESYSLPEMQQVDLLFCRNVTIYFKLDTTRQIMGKLARVLAPTGYLFLGDAETLWQVSDKFQPVEIRNTFLYRRATAGAVTSDTPHPTSPPRGEENEAAVERLRLPSPELPSALISSPLGVVDQGEGSRSHTTTAPSQAEEVQAVPSPRSPDVAGLLRVASRLADQGKSEEAIAALQRLIEADNLVAEAHYLLGILHSQTGQVEQAIAALRRAIYVEPAFALAHATLGKIYRQQGEHAKGRREFRNALRLLEGQPDEQLVRCSEEITCGSLRALCERGIEKKRGT